MGRNRSIATVIILALVVLFISVYEDAEDVLGLDAYLYPQSEAFVHGLGAFILILGFILAYRFGRASK